MWEERREGEEGREKEGSEGLPASLESCAQFQPDAAAIRVLHLVCSSPCIANFATCILSCPERPGCS